MLNSLMLYVTNNLLLFLSSRPLLARGVLGSPRTSWWTRFLKSDHLRKQQSFWETRKCKNDNKQCVKQYFVNKCSFVRWVFGGTSKSNNKIVERTYLLGLNGRWMMGPPMPKGIQWVINKILLFKMQFDFLKSAI